MSVENVEKVKIRVAEEVQKKWLDPDKIRGWIAVESEKNKKKGSKPIPPEAQEQISEVIRSLFAEYGLRPDLNHIVVLGDRPYVTREGLLYYARKSGQLAGITVEIIEREKDFCLVKATVTTKDGGQFEAYGDASTLNTNRMVSPHLIRMAETRAINRALREAFPIGLTSYEELAEFDVIDVETGEIITHEVPVNETKTKPITEAQRRKIITTAKEIWGEEYWEKEGKALMQLLFKKESTKELTREEASKFIEELEAIKKDKNKKALDEYAEVSNSTDDVLL